MIELRLRASSARPSWASWAVGTGLGAAAVVVGLAKGPPPHLVALGFAYLGLLIVIAAVDVRTRRASNRVVYPALIAAVAISLRLGPPQSEEALLGGLAAFPIMLLVAALGRGAMGGGDVKVAVLCGVVVGLHGVASMLAIAFVAGGVVALMLLVTKARRPKDTLPFTPFLVLGTLGAMAWLHLYLWA